MDFFGTNEHSFYHENFYLDQMLPYLKEDCRLFGVYFFFRNGPRSMKKYLTSYPGSSPNNFSIRWFMEQMDRNFLVTDTDDCGAPWTRGTTWAWASTYRGRSSISSPTGPGCARAGGRSPEGKSRSKGPRMGTPAPCLLSKRENFPVFSRKQGNCLGTGGIFVIIGSALGLRSRG